MRFRNLPIRRKLLVLTTATAAVALLFSGLAIVLADSALFREYVERDLNALAQILSDNSTAAISFEDPRSASEMLGALRSRSHVICASIYRKNGSVLATYNRPGSTVACPPPAKVPQSIFSSDDLMVSRPVLLSGTRIGTLVMLYDLGETGERMRIYGVTVFSVLLVATFFAFLLSARLSSVISNPISQLAAVTTSVSETRDYSLRAVKQTGDELGVLVDGFNEMLTRIQRRDADLRKALEDREEALRQAESARESLETTLASIGDGVISANVENVVVFSNRVAQRLLKTGQSDIARQPLRDVVRLVHERDEARSPIPLEALLRGAADPDSANDIVLLAGDGTGTPVDFSVAPIHDERGKTLGTVLVFRDVTGRRRANETSQLLASIVESSNDAIIGHDLQGTITSWNKGAEQIFGYPAAEVLGHPSSLIAPSVEADEMPAVLARIGTGQRVDQYQAKRRTKDGKLIDLSITVSPVFDALGRIAGASKIARDITEQVRVAERLAKLNADLQRTNDNLSRSNEDLERFAFIASHDLQEPLRMITIYSQLLVKQYPPDLGEQAARYVETIVNGANRMRDLLADLLAYTRIGAESDEEASPLDLNRVLVKVLENLKAKIDETQAEITCDPLDVLNAHEAHLLPLFQNLIENAIKYRSEAPPRIRITMQPHNGHRRFAVSDNGIGIAPAYHAKIFMAFKRLHSNTIPGTGIGLAICQRVVERYGGKIWVESESGRGATFIFTLPEVLFRKGKSNGA